MERKKSIYVKNGFLKKSRRNRVHHFFLNQEQSSAKIEWDKKIYKYANVKRIKSYDMKDDLLQMTVIQIWKISTAADNF